MIASLSPLDFVEPTSVLAGKLGETLMGFQRDLQTCLVHVDIEGIGPRMLVFARGQLVTVYQGEGVVERLNGPEWLQSLNGSSPAAELRTLALTLQDVRMLKIQLEQENDFRNVAADNPDLEKQFEIWSQHPGPALGMIHWVDAEALVFFPGKGASPTYSLFLTAHQVRHAAGEVSEIFARKDDYLSSALLSSEPRTLAWTEYLLYEAFSGLVSMLFEKFEKLAGRLLLNQIIRDVNFKATANDWSLSVNANSVTDLTLFASPEQAAEVYSSLLGVVFQHFESVLGGALLEMLVREAVQRLSLPARQVVKEFLPITNFE